MVKSASIIFGIVAVLVGGLLSISILLSYVSNDLAAGDEPAPTPITTPAPAEVVVLDETAQIVPMDPAPTTLVPEVTSGAISIPDIYDAAVISVVSVNSDQGNGSGWVWDTDGHIVTNYHVVQCSQCAGGISSGLEVVFSDTLQYAAELVAFDEASDLAVLKVTDRDNLVALPRGDSESLVVGQSVFAVGSPFGQDFSITAGIISAIDRDINSGFSNYNISGVIQTDTALNPGNSGGPLIDARGRIIGINTQISSTTGSNSGIGYAVPVNIALRVVPSLISDGVYEHAWLGVSGESVNRTIRDALELATNVRGFIVHTVLEDSPAEAAGLRGATSTAGAAPTYDGDIIIGISSGGDEPFRTVGDFEALISFLSLYTSPEDEISLLVLREGRQIVVTPTLKTRP